MASPHPPPIRKAVKTDSETKHPVMADDGWDLGRDLSAESMAEAIASFSNKMGDTRVKQFAGCMADQHRTLQQSFTRLCVQWFKYLATLSDMQYDLRNEASVGLAKKIVNTFPDELNLPMI